MTVLSVFGIIKVQGGVFMFRPKWKTKRAEALYEILKRMYFIGIFLYLPLMMALTLIADLKGGVGFIDLGYLLPLLLFLWITCPFYFFFISAGLSANGLLTLKTREIHRPKAKLVYILSLVLSAVMTVWNILAISIDLPSFLNISFVITPIFGLAEIIVLLVLQKKLGKDLAEETSFEDAFYHKITAFKNIMTAAIVTLLILAFLCIPYETLHFGDGGTVITNAIAYSVVDWNRGKDPDLLSGSKDEIEENLQYADMEQNTCVYFFPHNFKNYDELWDMKH